MALQTITDLNVDFYDRKYTVINAKQLDKNSRYLSITCYNRGEIFHINSGEHSAYVRYRKSDGYAVFNSCDINQKGNVIIELTEQMLVSDGFCVVDLMIVNKGGAKIDAETGEIVTIDNASILSSMVFHIDVQETAVEHADIESSYEYDGLNVALQKAESEYTEVMKTSKSWAVGGTGIRNGEDTDNSKYYANQASRSASAANTSALNAAASEELAESHMHNALTYMNNAETYMTNAKSHMDNTKSYMDATNEYMNTTKSHMDTTNEYMDNAKSHMDDAKSYMDSTNDYMNTTESYMNNTNDYMASANEYMNNAKTYMDNAKISETNAKASENASLLSETNAKASEVNASASETNAKTSEDNSKASETNAKISETNALNSANNAQSYTVGGTGVRENEDTDNAKYYYNEVLSIADNLNTIITDNDGNTINLAELVARFNALESMIGDINNILDNINGEVV